LGASILGGAALGVAAWWTDQLGFPWSAYIPANSIGAWIGVAFILGASARTVPTGALRGLIGLLSAVAVYYLLVATLGHGIRVVGAGHAATIWGAPALLAGPLLGMAGATWRHGHGWSRAISVAVLAAALIAEGIAFGAGRWGHIDQLVYDPGAFILAAETILGLLLPAILLRRGERLRGYLATAALAVLAALAIGPVISALRTLADRF